VLAKSVHHDPIGDSKPIAFLGRTRGHRISNLGSTNRDSPLALSLTLLENWLEQRAGTAPGWVPNALSDNLVYPDVPARLLTIAGVIVCVLNLAFYGRLMWSESQANGNERVDEVQKP